MGRASHIERRLKVILSADIQGYRPHRWWASEQSFPMGQLYYGYYYISAGTTLPHEQAIR